MSLVEVLVASGVLLVLLSMVLSFLYPSFRASSRGAMRVEMQQQANLAVDRLVIDLEQCAPASVSLLPPNQASDPSGVVMQPLRGFTGTGVQEWQKRLVVYYALPVEGKLYSKEWPPQVPALSGVTLSDVRPLRLDRVNFLELLVQKNGTERALAHGVVDFIVKPASMLSMQPISIHLLLERNVPGKTTPERFELRRSFSFRNDW